MKTTKRAWWTPYKYAAPSDWEHFMEDMAAQGWNVDKIRQSSSFCMVFRKTEPKRYRYVMDLNAFPKKDYTATFEAFGWELVGKMASEYIWRKEYEGERPEAFSSEESHSGSDSGSAVFQPSGRICGARCDLWGNGGIFWDIHREDIPKAGILKPATENGRYPHGSHAGGRETLHDRRYQRKNGRFWLPFPSEKACG